MPQTKDFRDWCAFVENKTGSGQAWAGRYIPRWNGFLSRVGLGTMIEIVRPWDFENAEYAIEVLDSWERRKDEESWEAFKAQERVEAVQQRTTKTTGWSAETELQNIIERTGLPRGPEAVAFAAKWGLTLD